MSISIAFLITEVAISQSLLITVSNIQIDSGQVMIAVYNSKQQFLSDAAFLGKAVSIQSGRKVHLHIEDIPDGQYAVSVFHDVDGDNELDLNGFGKPVEPIGFSNNVKGLIGPPRFSKASFWIDQKQERVDIRLR